MHLITLERPLDLGSTLGVLGVGEYICADINAFEFGVMAERGAIQVEPFCVEPETRPTALTRLIVMKSGAWGDLLLLLPVLEELHAKHPELEVAMSCFPLRFPLFDALTWLKLLPYPLPKSESNDRTFISSLDRVMEDNPEKHATDAFADFLGVKVENYKPNYAVTDKEKLAAKKYFTGNRPLVGVQMMASTANRNYSLNKWAQVIGPLEDKGWEVLLFGTKGQVPPLPKEFQKPYIKDLSNLNLTFRETSAILSHCNAFVGVDSAFVHMCDAVGVNAIGLYGPFDWRTRVGHAVHTRALSGIGECAPCNWHAHNGRQFPPNMPCSKVGQCVVLDTIPPERIVAKVDALRP